MSVSVSLMPSYWFRATQKCWFGEWEPFSTWKCQHYSACYFSVGLLFVKVIQYLTRTLFSWIHQGIVNYKTQFIQFVRVPFAPLSLLQIQSGQTSISASSLLHCVCGTVTEFICQISNHNFFFQAIFVQEVVKFFDATCSSSICIYVCVCVCIIHFSIGFIKKAHGNVKMLICEYFQTCAGLNR